MLPEVEVALSLRHPGPRITGDELGLDRGELHDAVTEFAFEAAERGAVAPQIVHCWKEPSGLSDAADGPTREPLTDVRRARRDKFPGVEVIERAVVGQTGSRLVEALRVTRRCSALATSTRRLTWCCATP